MNKIKALFSWIIASKVRLVGVVVLILLLVFAGNKLLGAKSSQPQYQTATVEKGTIVSSVTASGTVLTANISNITTSASGVVKAVYVKDGDLVTQGQKLAELTLDMSGAQKSAAVWASYLSAKNAVDTANVTLTTLQSDMFSKWDTFKTLAQSSAYQNSDSSPRYDQRAAAEFHIADDNWLAAEAKYKNQQAVIVQSQAALNSAWLAYQASNPVISAPTSGTISNVTIVPGMTIQTSTSTDTTGQTSGNGTRIAVIKYEGMPLLTFNISEIDIPKIHPGQKATITLDSLPNKTYTGKVVTVDRIGSTSNNVTSYATTIQLDTTAGEILPNMAANANIILETKSDILLVPSTAIQTQSGESFAKVLRNGSEQDAPVQVGISSDTQTEIVSGLSAGDAVITGTTTNTSTSQRSGGSIFGGGFGGGALRPGGFGGGGGQRR